MSNEQTVKLISLEESNPKGFIPKQIEAVKTVSPREQMDSALSHAYQDSCELERHSRECRGLQSRRKIPFCRSAHSSVE